MAGIRPGMRVLEVGSGMGDVALLLAEIVGPGGRVLGVDSVGLEHAGERTRQQGCSSWVSFKATNLDELDVPDQFDAIAGRYILLYQHDPGTTICHLLKFLKASGIVVFHELGGGRGSYLYRWIANTFISVSPRMGEMGLAMPSGVVADETLANNGSKSRLSLPEVKSWDQFSLARGRGSPSM